MLRPRAILLALVPLVSSVGVARGQEYRVHPDGAARLSALKTLGLVQPTMLAFELPRGSEPIPRPDWAELARANVAAGLEKELAAQGFLVKRFEPTTPEAKEELRQVSLLYTAVGGAIIQATYLNDFPWKRHRFEYTVGDVGALAAAAGVDALVFVDGVSNNSTGARLGGGLDVIVVALVDRTGDVLWFNRAQSDMSDLRKPYDAQVLVRDATERLRRVRR